MNELVFFDKEGNYLNFQYDSNIELYSADLILHENSSDTFKTLGIYAFERIPAFQFADPQTRLEKFQLFNEYGLNITGSIYANEQVTKVEAVNNDAAFKSKWIYGENFEKKFPVGSEIRFESNLFEFEVPERTYTVVSSKKGAVMVISDLTNYAFNILYGSSASMTQSYDGKSISGINGVGVHNYLSPTSSAPLLSVWSEPEFYSMLYEGRKLNLVNTGSNDGVVTVKDTSLLDKVYFEYVLPASSFSQSSDLWVEVSLRTDLPLVYQGGMTVSADRIHFFESVPEILKPGTKFRVLSELNDNVYTVTSIDSFSRFNTTTRFQVGDQVLWQSGIYQCVQAYTQSATSGVTPDDTGFWTRDIDSLPVTSMIPEVLADTQLYLNSNTFYFQTLASSSTASNQNELTLASCAQRWADDLSGFNIDFRYEDGALRASLLWASEYATVKYYRDVLGSASLAVGTVSQVLERTIETEETLRPEYNRDISDNFRYRVYFTDIDQYGIVLTFNGLPYQQEVQWVYDGLRVDMQSTIDRTVRAWVATHYSRLLSVGIVCRVDYTLSPYPFSNADSISFYTFYPNVPLEFEVAVGTTAQYFITHSDIDFTEVGPALSLTINGRQYMTQYGSQSISAAAKVGLWVEDHGPVLDDYGIYVRSKASRLYFDLKIQGRRLEYQVYIGKTPLPGENSFRVNQRFGGNHGALVTSNAVTLAQGPTYSPTFLDVNGASAGIISFATGMITSVNNSVYPFNNQEYNLLEVGETRMVLSYQGPFWGGTVSRTRSPYVSIAFDTGFSQSLVPGPDNPLNLDPGAYSPLGYNKAFDIWRGYTNIEVPMPDDSEPMSGLADIVYLPSTRRVYIYGTSIKVHDGITGAFVETIRLAGMTTALRLIYSDYDGYLFAVSADRIYKVDPSSNQVVLSVSLGFTAVSAAANPVNGDLYVSGSTGMRALRAGATSLTIVYNGGASQEVAVDDEKNEVYLITASNTVLQFDGSSLAQTAAHSVPGSTSRNSMAYNRIDDGMYVIGDVVSFIRDGVVVTYTTAGASSNYLLFDSLSGTMLLSQNSLFSSLSGGGAPRYSSATTKYGPMVVNSYDERVYLASQDGSFRDVYIIDTKTEGGPIVNKVQNLPSNVTRMAYNSDRGTVWCIMPGSNRTIEIGVNIMVYFKQETESSAQNPDRVGENQYGTLHPDYVSPLSIWLSSRDYIRKPRMNFEGERRATLAWRWETDDRPEFFLYDFSGNQLETTGVYRYTGPKPLRNATLNRRPNRDINKVSSPESQQTIFPEVSYQMDFINSSQNISFYPSPLECFVGYNSETEGTSESTLNLILREEVSFRITPTQTNNDVITFSIGLDDFSYYGVIQLAENSVSGFLEDSTGSPRGLKVGQEIRILINDVTNRRNKYISLNNGIRVSIRELVNRQMIVDFGEYAINNETTVLEWNGVTTYLSVDFEVMERVIAQVNVKGQTEIEDPRYEINLGNIGKLVASNDVYIFKKYDINEQGIDWPYLNRKRKEMLMVKDQIFPYVGSYKAIINAINYFGYNDLELYEYYRNVDLDSPDYGKLFKFEVPDIFDNTVPGWKENDWLRWSLPNPNVQDTNLFNLTYRITDREGNNVLLYSLAEVITKLMGLKRWLESNVIPISHRILDITGRADFVQTNAVVHKSYSVKQYRIEQSMSPVDLFLNEAYLMPVNSGSSVYNCVIDFSVQPGAYAPDHFELRIKTYKTYPEWQPFKTYSRGQIVSYFNQNYESAKDYNRLNDPRAQSVYEPWSGTFDYTKGQIVEYNRNYYVYNATQSSLSITASNPYIDVINGYDNWDDITQWRRLDYVPVQSYREFRTGTHSFNFAVDTSIDPYVVAEVTSENGYGLTWTTKKSYQIAGILNIEQTLEEVDTPGPIKIWDKLTTTTTTTTVRPQYIDFWEAVSSECVDE